MNINFRSRHFNVIINDMIFELFGHISRYKCWEFERWMNPQNEKRLGFEISYVIRVLDHYIFYLNLSIGSYNIRFELFDNREWDAHTDKFITWQDYCKLPEKREGKPKIKYRKRGKEKWYFSSKYLKLYNLDFLNDPYGITVEVSHLPILFCSILQFGKNLYCNTGLKFNFIKTPQGLGCDFEISLLGYFIKLKIQKNWHTFFTQIAGEDEKFKYYTMENEHELAEPHIHVCVDFDNPKWHGEKFENFQPLKTITTVLINETQELYSADNLILEDVCDFKIEFYKKQICDWLNANDTHLDGVSNSQLALRNYHLSNPGK